MKPTDEQTELIWVEFWNVEKLGWKPQKLPPERKDVLCKISTKVNETGGVVAGYLRYAAGDKKCPYFVCGGIPGPWEVTHWCDCLPDDFNAPGWSTPGKPLAAIIREELQQ